MPSIRCQLDSSGFAWLVLKRLRLVRRFAVNCRRLGNYTPLRQLTGNHASWLELPKEWGSWHGTCFLLLEPENKIKLNKKVNSISRQADLREICKLMGEHSLPDRVETTAKFKYKIVLNIFFFD